MGMFDFVKTAGRKLGLFQGGDNPPATRETPEAKALVAAAQKAAAAAASGDAAAQAARIETDVVAAIAVHGIGIEGLHAWVQGDTVTLQGRTTSRADAEKAVLIAGNTEGVARVDDKIAVVAAEPPAVFHTVVKGDTLSKIAKAQYGDAMAYPLIFEANRPMLTHPDKIYPGQVLRIPPKGTANA